MDAQNVSSTAHGKPAPGTTPQGEPQGGSTQVDDWTDQSVRVLFCGPSVNGHDSNRAMWLRGPVNN